MSQLFTRLSTRAVRFFGQALAHTLPVLMLGLWANYAAAQTSGSASLAAIDESSLVAHEPEFSGVVQITRGKEAARTLAVGESDGRVGKHNTEHTLFWIGSLSKQFTAAAVLRLVQQNKLDLEASLHEVVAGLKPLQKGGQTCNLKWLLQHRCGFTRDDHSFRSNIESLADGQELVRKVNALGLDSTPGSEFAYSNLGYLLAGWVVQQVSGMPFERFLHIEFWEPLAMQHTGIAANPNTEFIQARGQLYALFGYIDALRWLLASDELMRRQGAAGGIYSSASDLTRWNRALHTGRVLPDELYQVMTSPGDPDAPGGPDASDDPDAWYGMGIEQQKKTWGSFFWHNGALEPYAFNSFMAWVPASRTSLVILANRSVYRAHATRLGFKLLARLHNAETPAARSFSALGWLNSLLPILAVLGIPYVLALLALAAWRGPRKGALRWMTDFLGSALLLFLLLALYRDPDWYAMLAACVFALSLGVCLWRRRSLRAMPLVAEKSLLSAAIGVFIVLALAWYLLGTSYLIGGVVACIVLTAVVYVPRPHPQASPETEPAVNVTAS